MKRKNREVSIFSMSALDLFASALGAFILIAIVMFPYFPNTGTADQRDLDAALERLQAEEADNEELQHVLREIREDLERRLEAVRAEAERAIEAARQERNAAQAAAAAAQQDAASARDAAAAAQQDAASARDAAAAAQRDAETARDTAAAAQRDARDLQRQLDELELPHLDLVIALDVTGSMSNEIEGLKAEIDGLSTILLRLAPSVAVGVVAFGDRQWPRPVTQFRLEDVGAGGNRTRLTGFINSLSINMGMSNPPNPDQPEAVLEAVRAAVNMPWRSQAERRQIVVITDNPAYPGEVEATVSAAASFAAAGRGGSVSTVFVNTDGTSGVTESFLRRVASEGGGQAVRAGGSMTANLLLSLL